MINPILLSVEDQQTKKLLALLTGHGNDDIHLSLQEQGRLKRLGLLASQDAGRLIFDLDDVLSAGPMLLRFVTPLIDSEQQMLSCLSPW